MLTRAECHPVCVGITFKQQRLLKIDAILPLRWCNEPVEGCAHSVQGFIEAATIFSSKFNSNM